MEPDTIQVAPNGNRTSKTPTNVILLIPDGFGPASAALAREYLRWRDGITSLAFDRHQLGSVRTFAADSRITDSAAGATAYATGAKTNNRFVATSGTGEPLGTVLEGARRNGKVTGLVATSRITHATPAAFSAHTPDRDEEDNIAAQQIAKTIEVLLGGGRRHFRPNSAESEGRRDERNLLREAQDRGYQLVGTAEELSEVENGPLLGLFSEGHMDYEIDRTPKQPSLSAMTEAALRVLSNREAGYFLMVEGSRIDHAGHDNDAAAHLREILGFNEAVQTALRAAQEDGDTLVVIVSDHETGGLTLGRARNGQSMNAWNPEMLSRVQASSTAIAERLRRMDGRSSGRTSARRRLETAVSHFTGIADLTGHELDRLAPPTQHAEVSQSLCDVVNRRARLGWTTDAHTAVDVNVYAFGPGARRFAGNHDNTHIGQTLAKLFDIDLGVLTEAVRTKVRRD